MFIDKTRLSANVIHSFVLQDAASARVCRRLYVVCSSFVWVLHGLRVKLACNQYLLFVSEYSFPLLEERFVQQLVSISGVICPTLCARFLAECLQLLFRRHFVVT